MHPFELKYDSFNRTERTYYVHAYGIDRNSERQLMVVSEDPTASSCSPFYWEPSVNKRPGKAFYSKQKAKMAIAEASNYNYNVQSIEVETIEISAFEVTVTKEFKSVE